MTTTRSRSKPMSTFRAMSTPRPVQSIVARNVTRTAAKRGVNSRVRTGAMFSTTLCLASTSQDATRTAPAAPHGSSHDSKNGSMSIPMARKIMAMNAISTPPPSAIRT